METVKEIQEKFEAAIKTAHLNTTQYWQEYAKWLEQRLLLSSEAEKGEKLISALESIMSLPGEWGDAKQIARKALGEHKYPVMDGIIKAHSPSPPTAQEKRGVEEIVAYKCKECGHEEPAETIQHTTNYTEADGEIFKDTDLICRNCDAEGDDYFEEIRGQSPAPAAPDKGEEKPEDCIVGVNSYAPNGIVDDPFQPNATTESDARAFLFNERMAGRLKGYDKIPYELRTEIYRVMEGYKNLKPTPSVEKSEGEEAVIFPSRAEIGAWMDEYAMGWLDSEQRSLVFTGINDYDKWLTEKIQSNNSSLLHSSGDRGRKEWPSDNERRAARSELAKFYLQSDESSGATIEEAHEAGFDTCFFWLKNKKA